MNKHCYLLFFSFFLLSGYIQSFAAIRSDLEAPLLEGSDARPSYQSLARDVEGPEGRGAGSAAGYLVTETSRPPISSGGSSSLDELLRDTPPNATAILEGLPPLDILLTVIDTSPAQKSLVSIIHYLYFVKGKKAEEMRKVSGTLEKADRGAIGFKNKIVDIYKGQAVYHDDDQLLGYLYTEAFKAVQDTSPLTRLSGRLADRTRGLIELAERLIGELKKLTLENQDIKRQLGEVQLLIQQQASASRQTVRTAISIPSPQTVDESDHQRMIDSLARSNRCRCYAIGGLSTALGLSLIYGTWSLIHILH